MGGVNRSTGYDRADRVGDLILEFLGKLLVQQLNDPRVRDVTLTGIEVRRDLKHVRVYFNVRDGDSSSEQALLGLAKATGFIRARIGRELKLRFVPAVEFVFDETADRAQRIEDLLRQTSPK